MPEGISPGLWPPGEAVRLVADRNFPHLAGRCVDCVNDVVIPAGQPERLPIGADDGLALWPIGEMIVAR